jgi:hypothetical protein
MYSQVALPLFSQFEALFRGLEKRTFRTNLLSSFRTFPSLSQLLPSKDIDYICYSPICRANPLNEPYMNGDLKQVALKAQSSFDRADDLLQAAEVPVFSIYTTTAAGFQTDHQYFVRGIGDPRPNGYEIIDVYLQDWDGDGTVPAYSARGNRHCRPAPVVNCRPSFMCDSSAVLDWLSQITSTSSLTERA